jgi:hypothetical protein
MIFKDEADLVDQGRCPICMNHVPAAEIENMDVLSTNEFLISGLCQSCQDKVFTAPPKSREEVLEGGTIA